MRGVSSGEGRAEAVPLDGTNQHHGRLAFVGCCLGVSSVQLDEVVSTDIGTERDEFVVGKVGNQGG